MSLKTKYSTRPRRAFVRISFNKYNLKNVRRFRGYRKWMLKIKKKLKLYYKIRLIIKQKLKRYYGGLKETAFRKLYDMASFYKGNPVHHLFIFLESRLDTILCRSHFSYSIFHSKQLINQGYVLVNGKRIKNSNYLIKPHDLINIDKNYIYLLGNILYYYFKNKIIKPIPYLDLKDYSEYFISPNYLDKKNRFRSYYRSRRKEINKVKRYDLRTKRYLRIRERFFSNKNLHLNLNKQNINKNNSIYKNNQTIKNQYNTIYKNKWNSHNISTSGYKNYHKKPYDDKKNYYKFNNNKLNNYKEPPHNSSKYNNNFNKIYNKKDYKYNQPYNNKFNSSNLSKRP